jgi:hypothetical protein
MFTIIPADDFIWNRDELIDYLVQHQNQRIRLSVNAEGCSCKSIGLYRLLDSFRFESVDIITANAVEYHNKYNIIHKSTLMYANVTKPIDTRYHIWNKNKIFCARTQQILKYFDNECVDLIVTSPPYDTLRTYENKNDFNFDVYVPPVVPYEFNYFFNN